MDVIVIETEAFNKIIAMFQTTMETVTRLAEESKHLNDDRWMSLKEVQQYLGFGRDWILNRKADLGFFQDGARDLKFRKSAIDQYMTKHFIQKK